MEEPALRIQPLIFGSLGKCVLEYCEEVILEQKQGLNAVATVIAQSSMHKPSKNALTKILRILDHAMALERHLTKYGTAKYLQNVLRLMAIYRDRESQQDDGECSPTSSSSGTCEDDFSCNSSLGRQKTYASCALQTMIEPELFDLYSDHSEPDEMPVVQEQQAQIEELRQQLTSRIEFLEKAFILFPDSDGKNATRVTVDLSQLNPSRELAMARRIATGDEAAGISL